MNIALQNICNKLTANPAENIQFIICETRRSFNAEVCVFEQKLADSSIVSYICSRDKCIKSETNQVFEGQIFFKEIDSKKTNYIAFSDLSNSSHRNENSIIKDYNLSSYLVAAVNVEDKIAGTLSIGYQNTFEFTDEDISKLKDFTAIITMEMLHLSTCQNLSLSNDKYTRVFNSASECILLLKNRIIVEINTTGCSLFGYEHEYLIGKDWVAELIDSSVNDIDISSLYGTNSENKENNSIKFKKSDGSFFDGEIILTELDSFEEFNFMVTVRDVSSRVLYEKELIEAKENANEMSRMKSLSLASMSHELRTPLNSIIGFSDLLLDEETTEEEKDMFSRLIRSAGKSLMQLIGDIIDISKIEAGQVTVKKESLNVNSFLQDLMLTFSQEKETQGKTDIELIMMLSDKASGLNIKTDPHRLRQIFNNLLTNSLKFIDEGFIEFGYLSITPDFIQFYVKDTGIGIEKTKREKIFEQFGRDLSAYDRNPDGTGLGLAISKSFVELLGGKIWLDSEINAGTTFYFTIPLGGIPEEKNQTLSKLRSSWRNKTILIADDVEENYIFLNGVLLNTGINVLWAKDGQEAVDICNSRDIDMVLMDIRMPVMDGFEASKLIREKDADIIIIAQTAFASPEDKLNCIEFGCNEYLKKPIDYEKLIRVIKKYFG